MPFEFDIHVGHNSEAVHKKTKKTVKYGQINKPENITLN